MLGFRPIKVKREVGPPFGAEFLLFWIFRPHPPAFPGRGSGPCAESYKIALHPGTHFHNRGSGFFRFQAAWSLPITRVLRRLLRQLQRTLQWTSLQVRDPSVSRLRDIVRIWAFSIRASNQSACFASHRASAKQGRFLSRSLRQRWEYYAMQSRSPIQQPSRAIGTLR